MKTPSLLEKTVDISLEYLAVIISQAGLTDDIKCYKKVSSDGSDRRLYRIKFQGGSSCLVVFPAQSMPQGMAEAKSCALICAHLYERGIAVPKLFGFDEDSGAVVFEDFGNFLLYDAVHSTEVGGGEITTLYRQAVEELLKFQIAGVKTFQADYCWDTSHYDTPLMLHRESGYFYRELCVRWLGLGEMSSQLQLEFVRLAERVSLEPSHFLLHRDFQSRNLMVQGNNIRIIDFQGARFGPLGYDLCSLLNDPYVVLGEKCKEQLLRHFVSTAANYISLDLDTFLEGYYHIALQRNLQVLGAYVFLSQEKKKYFFQQFIDPALKTLCALLSGPLCGEYPELQSTTEIITTLQAATKPLVIPSVNEK